LGRMAEGDAKARNLLIEHNLRLVAHIVKKFDNTGEDMEDLISIGTIGLIKAIESYRPNKGTKLATFAARCIENEILMHLKIA
jgi:RNA polymerase sporulation-specific sigma factor